jgi:diketogulonate reductase-like aldo/keto reductase
MKIATSQVVQLARKYDCHVAQIIFSFAIGIGMLPLTGTTNPQHMLIDLELGHLQLDPNELAMIEIVNAANS